MICPKCYCDPCICAHITPRVSSNTVIVDSGTTNYCVLCEQANRKIEKAIEILKTVYINGAYEHCSIRIVKALEVLEGE